jgi:outer membrane protein OmpA-like peptidoglycan-associated protein
MACTVRARSASSALALAAFLASAAVSAQGTPQGIPLDRFDPAPVGDRMFGVPSPFVAGHLTVHAGVLLDYAHDPLVLRSASNNADEGNVISSDLFLHVNASLALWNRLLINVDVPIALAQAGSSPSADGTTFASPNKAQMGELRAGLRVRIWGEYDDPFQIGVGGYVWFPTGPSNAYVGDGNVRGQPQLLLGGRGANRIVWSLAGGPEIRATEVFAGVTQGTQFNVGAGIGVLLGDERRFQLGPEIYGAFTLASSKTPADALKRSTNLEILADARYRVIPDLEIGVGLGPGLTVGPGTPDFRGVLMIAYTPEMKKQDRPDRDGDGIFDDEDACPDVKGVKTDDPKTNGCPPDRDGDGILDDDDACPDVKGVKTDDPKTNGCPPDQDTDGDGILDKDDACPKVKGVKSDDPKKNGCPPDRDEDGIPDAVDACPDVKGVKTDDPKTNGCPPDTDGDGITDDKDACPEEKGPPDPDPAKNGCPRVHVTDKEIVILEQVQFDTGKATIKKVSDGLLDAVAEVFKDHADILRVEVQGHTDNRGTPNLNKGLSQRRAEAVLKALAARGIATGRLEAKGYGQDVPIGDNKTDEGRQKNRRVQFKILERKPKASK